MIAETPIALLITIAVISVFALVSGYCIALLRTKKRFRQLIDTMRGELAYEREVAESELQSATESIGELRSSLAGLKHKAETATEREEAMENHAQLQAQRIQTLEGQCAAFEEQQIRLQRDFATYKSNKHREREVARHAQDTAAEHDELPLLSRRIDVASEEDVPSSKASLLTRDGSAQVNRDKARKGLSAPLARELDIPSLSEAELPDSVDDLKFESDDVEDNGVLERG